MTPTLALRPIEPSDVPADSAWLRPVTAPGGAAWGGWADDTLVAYAKVRSDGDGDASFTVVVDPARRGQGIGSLLVGALARQLPLGQVRGLQGWVSPGDRPVRRMLHRAGFSLTSPFVDSRGLLLYRYQPGPAAPVAPRIKICCIASVAEAQLAVRAGASAVGLVSSMPSGPGIIPDSLIATIAREVRPPTATFLLTSIQTAAGIAEQHRRCGTSTIQICDRLGPGAYPELRRLRPGASLIQVVHVTGPESVAEAVAISGEADGLLLDSGNQNLAVKELGGTGRVHDWEVSAAIRRAVSIPVFLAGGLDASNAARAVDQVRPWGLDLCSRVRTDGRLDPAKLAAFMVAVGGG